MTIIEEIIKSYDKATSFIFSINGVNENSSSLLLLFKEKSKSSEYLFSP